MPGIYFHIPFCRQRCHYCDFYSNTDLKKKEALVCTLIKELSLRKNWVSTDHVETIYFGGGTPSLLHPEYIQRLIDSVQSEFNLSNNAEITLEANPDDLNDTYINLLARTKVNRLSIGLQSFNDDQLKTMHRRHNTTEAIKSVQRCQAAGFHNISIDLIYGLPGSNEAQWISSLNMASSLKVQHLSAYHLTFEEKTVFDVKRKKGELFPLTEDESVRQFQILSKWAENNGFEQYEISNFSLPGYRSRHNSSYWQQKEYLGIGPSAHSYNRKQRCWNVANLQQYIEQGTNNQFATEFENLSLIDNYNEFIMTSLRTMEGIDLEKMKADYGEKQIKDLLRNAKKYLQSEKLNLQNNYLRLSGEGILISDAIMADLMVDEI